MDLPQVGVLEEIVLRSARLRERLGEEFGERPLVLPTGDFFPDLFQADDASLGRLLKRMQHHTGTTDLPIEVRLLDAAPGAGAAACGSGACATPSVDTEERARITETRAGWTVHVLPSEALHPTVLTCQLALALSHVFLLATSETPDEIEQPFEVTRELAAVQLGLGALVLQGSDICSKGCGGLRVSRLTSLSVGELGFAFALWARASGHATRRAASHLDVTQQAVLSEATALLASNASVVERYRSAPHSLVAPGSVRLGEAKSWLARLFGGSRPEPKDAFEAALNGAPIPKALARDARGSALRQTAPLDPRREELKALVAEVLAGEE